MRSNRLTTLPASLADLPRFTKARFTLESATAASSYQTPQSAVVNWYIHRYGPQPTNIFRFTRLGLRSNPFRVLTADEWADVAVVPDAIEVAFINGEHLLILGKRGRGKSTLLRTLIRRLQWQHLHVAYERLPSGKWRYDANIKELDAFAPDEAQRLALWEWPALLNRVRDGMRLIMGNHRNDKWIFNLNRIPIHVY